MILSFTPTRFSDYELIDCGNFLKLERFGTVITIRPEPQAGSSLVSPRLKPVRRRRRRQAGGDGDRLSRFRPWEGPRMKVEEVNAVRQRASMEGARW